MSIATHTARVGNFTSSSIVAITDMGSRPMTPVELAARPSKGPGSRTTTVEDGIGQKAYDYVNECNWERRLGRPMDREVSARALTWGTVCEKFLFAKRLGIEYVPNFDEPKVHPIFPCWSGTPDCKRQDTVGEIKSPFTAESFCKLVDPLYNGLEGLAAFNALRNGYKNKAGLEVKKHTDAEKYFWQCVSNACLENLPKAELLIFCPYLSDLPELADFISNLDDVDMQIRAEWIHSAIINENYDALPWIPNGGFYKSLNAIVFDVPDADRIFLTYRVQQLSPLLIKRN